MDELNSIAAYYECTFPDALHRIYEAIVDGGLLDNSPYSILDAAEIREAKHSTPLPDLIPLIRHSEGLVVGWYDDPFAKNAQGSWYVASSENGASASLGQDVAGLGRFIAAECEFESIWLRLTRERDNEATQLHVRARELLVWKHWLDPDQARALSNLTVDEPGFGDSCGALHLFSERVLPGVTVPLFVAAQAAEMWRAGALDAALQMLRSCIGEDSTYGLPRVLCGMILTCRGMFESGVVMCLDAVIDTCWGTVDYLPIRSGIPWSMSVGDILEFIEGGLRHDLVAVDTLSPVHRHVVEKIKSGEWRESEAWTEVIENALSDGRFGLARNMALNGLVENSWDADVQNWDFCCSTLRRIYEDRGMPHRIEHLH